MSTSPTPLLPTEPHVTPYTPEDLAQDDRDEINDVLASEDSEGEDLFGSDMVARDYEENARLDRYDDKHVDDGEYSDLDYDAKYVYI